MLFLLLAIGFTVTAQEAGYSTFTTDDGSFSFEYPSDWYIEIVNADSSNPHIVIDNLPSDERYDREESIFLQVFPPKKSFDIVLTNASTPLEVIKQSGASQDTGEISVGDISIAYGYLIFETDIIDASQLTVIADLGSDYWVFGTVGSFSGGLQTLRENESIILDIFQTMTHTPPLPAVGDNPDLPQAYSGLVGIWQYGSIEISLPADWYITNIYTVMFSNEEGRLLNQQPTSGRFIAAINGSEETKASVDIEAMGDHCNTRGIQWTAEGIVNEILNSITLEQEIERGIVLTEPEQHIVNGIEIITLYQYQDAYETWALFVDMGNNEVITISVLGLRGEIAQFEDQLLKVASTIRYTRKPCNTLEDS